MKSIRRLLGAFVGFTGALGMFGANPTPVNAQVLCFSTCPAEMIDYGRGLVLDGYGWHPAQITQSTVSWEVNGGHGAYTIYNTFDRYTGRGSWKMVHHPPYTNPPYYGESQCQPTQCLQPKY